MVQPAESLLRKDPTPSYGTNPAVRCPLLKPEMRAVLMMVMNIRREQSLQMAFIQRNHVVQQVSSTASHPPLRDEISLQYSRKPAWCHRTTVSGVTTMRAFFHCDQN